jgi:hypothetical protein
VPVRRAPNLILLAATLVSCASPEPRRDVEMSDLETYWAIDPSVGQTQYMAPVARFQLRNKGPNPLRYVDATATFRRKGEENQSWGSDFKQLTPPGKPLAAGQQVLVVLKSDARYYSTGPPESMFEHQLFKDAMVEVYVRIGSSAWAKMGEAAVERRIGSKSLQQLGQ